jgi:transcriptional regulator with XRE-family HTH domain
MLRQWRLRRRFSQLDLSVRAEVSTRHLSFVETGRAKPSPEMILHLADHLAVPLRERNQILLAAGYAPRYSHTALDEVPMAAAREALELVLRAHPYPAIIVDRYWNLVQSNDAVGVLLEGVDPALLAPPANAVRLALHPDGLRRRARNFEEYAEHLLQRLHHLVEATDDPKVVALLDEMRGYVTLAEATGDPGVVMPLVLDTPVGELRLFSTLATFGSPLDVTLEELTIEAFYPADPESRRLLEDLLASVAA